MTDENAKKKYVHLKGLIAGKLKTGNPVRDDLIVSDAERHLADLIKKRPNIDFDNSKAEDGKTKSPERKQEEVKQPEADKKQPTKGAK